MAVRAKKNGFEVYYRDPATHKQRSRYFKTRVEADREDRRIKYLLEFDRMRLLDEDSDRTDISSLVSSTNQADGSAQFKFGTLFERYKATNPEACAHIVHRLQDLANRFGNVDVRRFSTATYLDMQAYLAGKGNKPSSINRILTGVGSVLRLAKEIGYIDDLPRKCRISGATRYETFVPPDILELDRLYKEAPEHLKRVIILGGQFGMRVGQSELLSLKWSDIDFTQWVIRLRSAKKNDKVQFRVIPIPEVYRPLFLKWCDEDAGGCGYVVNYNGNPVGTIYHGWTLLLNRVGITRKLRPYDLRHAFATNMLEAGADIGVVANLMGHADASMITKHYQFVRDEHKAATMDRLTVPETARMESACMERGGGEEKAI